MKRIIGGIMLLFSTANVLGQEAQGEPNAWFLMLNHYSITDKWRIGNELHIRRNDWLREQQQFIIRPYMDFKANDNITLTAGYTYLKTSRFGASPLPVPVPEHNVWEQVTLNQKLEKLKISHRLRMEHRFIGSPVQNPTGDYAIDGHKFANRFRYRLTVKRDLSEDWFIHIFNEIWINQDGLKPSSFDRNWLYGGAGYRLARNANIQVAYMHQWISSTDDTYFERPTVQLTLQCDI